ncbi:hypothetical protein RJ639_009191 [Escallonia herrerae]|uniref:RING-CH-type domain-containing protein n=1 Tax=Escallonia herrerae TaxID=1293975 RepID=A0AA89AV04_9ASTE|nr:hypothetical protein RJ639_009191 [Escallonia herrerae]
MEPKRGEEEEEEEEGNAYLTHSMAGGALRCEDACILRVEDAKQPEKEKRDTVVHVNKHGNGSFGGEKVCRICHLGSECSAEVSDLVELGCGCKDELGVSHLRCAETWFKQKGNRSELAVATVKAKAKAKNKRPDPLKGGLIENQIWVASSMDSGDV